MRMMFDRSCRVVEYRPETKDGVTVLAPHTLFAEIPCRVARRRSPAGAVVRGACEVTQEITLLLPKGVALPVGATVELGGASFHHSGMVAEFPSHNEYRLVWEGCA